ncbi:hypothetical protein FRC11_006391 [Ceratobasidium sp. 423]|nr:hypothetical protein FRC11_006391 [Ceratobasidium sp. 423]
MSLDSGSNSAGANGDRLHLTRLFKDDDERWRLERIGSDVGEGADAEQMRLLRRELKVAKTELVEDKSKLKIVEEQLAIKIAELANVQSELSRKTAELEEQREALDQAIRDLSTTTQEISEKDRELAERDETIHMKDTEIAEKDRMIAELDLDELTWSSIGQPPTVTTQPSQPQGSSSNTALPSSDTEEQELPPTTPQPIKRSVRSKRHPVSTALDVRLSELGWVSDSD